VDEVIDLFNRFGVRYLVLGGQAMRLSGMPRFSMDWDVWIPPKDVGNLNLISDLLGDELDSMLQPLGPAGENFIQTFQTRWGILDFHLGVSGLSSFDACEARAVMRPTETGTLARCLSDADLLKAKQAANRPKDQEDILFLRYKTGEA